MTRARTQAQNAVVEQVEQAAPNLEAMVRAGVLVNIKKMGQAERGVFVHQVMNGMVEEARQKDAAWLRLGLLWSFVVKNKVYKYCGDHIKNANDFLRELDLGIKRREMETYAQMAGIFGRAMRERGIEIPIRKLVMIAPLCKGDETESWVEKAATLPTQALEDEIREAKGLTPRDACAHPEATQEVWTRCGHCGKWIEKVREPS